MATVLSTLYPPLVDTFMPAFPNEQSAVVHFTVSPYNSSYEIQYLHVTLVNQKTNKNAFSYEDNVEVPSGTALINGVWIIPFAETLNGDTNPYLQLDRDANYYTLYIPPSLLKMNSNNEDEKRRFLIDCYYKVQLRFDKYIESIDGSTSLTTWNSDYLVQKRAYFSEWSSVCLLKAIPTITLHLNNFTMELDNYLQTTGTSITNIPSNFVIPVRTPQYMPGIIPFAGNLTFEGDNDSGIDNKIRTEYYRRDIRTTSNSEYIMSYRIKVYDELENLKRDSGIIYPAKAEKTNNFYWLCDLTTADAGNYKVELTFTTNNQYTFTKSFSFILIEPADFLKFEPTFTFDKIELPYHGQGYAWKRYDDPSLANYSALELDKMNKQNREDGLWYEDDNEKVLVTCEDGWVTLTITHKEIITPGYLFIKRASSLDGFQNWELIDCSYILYSNHFSRTIVDKTISSLVAYKYSAQYLTAKGNWTRTVFSPEIIYPDFHDILLSRGDKQLAIRYNAQIASMTPVVNRVKIDTLGGRYPRFAENAKLHYKQFQLSGLIIAESDYNRKFMDDRYYQQLDNTKHGYKNAIDIYDDKMGGKYGIRNDTVKETGIINVEIEDEEGNIETQTYSNGTYSIDISSADTATKKLKRDSQKNTSHDLYPMDNWWWEREFREAAIEWLNDGEPKLYRSMTEGNLIVMVDSVSLTPNAQLGRRVWNFSATIYEVGDGNSLQELDALGIYPLTNEYEATFNGTYVVNADTSIVEERIGQKYSVTAQNTSSGTTVVKTNTYNNLTHDIINSKDQIMNVYDFTIGDEIGYLYQGLNENYQFNPESVRLRDLKIQFESLPQWYDLTTIAPAYASPRVFAFTASNDEKGWLIKEGENIIVLEAEKDEDKNILDNSSWYNSWKSPNDDSGTTLTDFLTNWENNMPNKQSGNNLSIIDVDTGKDVLDIPIDEKTPGVIDALFKKENNYGLGYKLKLNLVSPHDQNIQLERTIFVNERGYYQVPSTMRVKEVTLFDGATATLDYIIEYDLKYDDATEPNSYEAAENIVGQISGEWKWNTGIAPLIYAKYYAFDKEESGATTQQSVDSWKAISFDGTPYTILNIQSSQDIGTIQYIVGRSGVLNLQTDYPTSALYVNGKRMVQAPLSRQKYLDEWEYVIDQSVYDAINYEEQTIESGSQFWYIVYNNSGADWSDWASSDEVLPDGIPVIVYLSNEIWDESTARDIVEGWYSLEEKLPEIFDRVEKLKPMPNTVYAIANSAGGFDYKIFYLDEGWFNIEFPNLKSNDLSIAYARVPVYGMIDYRATIMKKFWDPKK